LGLVVDAENRRFQIPEDKLRDIRNFAGSLMVKSSCKTRSLAKLIGKILALQRAWPHARRVCWSLIECLYRIHEVRFYPEVAATWKLKIPLTAEAKEELVWIHSNIQVEPFRPFLSQRLLLIFTDAAGSAELGWGFHIPALNLWGQGHWTQKQLQKYPLIHQKEFYAVIQAIKVIPEGYQICLATDSTVVRKTVAVMGGHRKKEDQMMVLSWKLFQACEEAQVSIERAVWLPGSLNFVADALSRWKASSSAEVSQLWMITQKNLAIGLDGWLPANWLGRLNRCGSSSTT
jgi:hypothetical protein